MKQPLLFILMGLLLNACSTIDRPFFWKIEKNGKSSHVLGTMHAGIDIRDLPPYVHTNLDSSTAVLLEITRDTEKNNPYFKRAKDLKEFFKESEKVINDNMAKNITTKKYFTNDQWNKLVAKTQKLGVDPTVLPYFTLPILKILVRDTGRTYVNFEADKILSTKSLDDEVEGKALLAQKPLFRLDSLQRMKPDCWRKLHAESVVFYLDHDNYDAINDFVEMVDDYKTGNAELMLRREKNHDTELEKCLLEDRNKYWLHVIDEHHNKNSPLFIAAGVRHFIGPGNVLEFLEKMGYKVTRYPLE